MSPGRHCSEIRTCRLTGRRQLARKQLHIDKVRHDVWQQAIRIHHGPRSTHVAPSEHESHSASILCQIPSHSIRLINSERNSSSGAEETNPRKPVELKITDGDQPLRGLEGLLNVRYENLNLIGYQSHAKIAAPVAV